MHELAIAEAIVITIQERLPGTPIRVVHLEIGRLSGVVADSVRFCFELVTPGTTLADAELDIAEPTGLVRCRGCDTEFEVPDLLVLCRCGSADVELLRGTQLRIQQVEVV